MPIFSNLGKIMLEKNMTYEDLQNISKIAPDTVARLRDERIATCKLQTLEKVAKAIGVNIKDLFECV